MGNDYTEVGFGKGLVGTTVGVRGTDDGSPGHGDIVHGGCAYGNECCWADAAGGGVGDDVANADNVLHGHGSLVWKDLRQCAASRSKRFGLSMVAAWLPLGDTHCSQLVADGGERCFVVGTKDSWFDIDEGTHLSKEDCELSKQRVDFFPWGRGCRTSWHLRSYRGGARCPRT